jgi:hypothetical protein
MKQFVQLKKVFNFRYFRYLLKKGKDAKYQFVPRPAPIFFKIEEEKKEHDENDDCEECDTQSWEVPESGDWQGRLKVACQEVIKVAQVLDFLLVK